MTDSHSRSDRSVRSLVARALSVRDPAVAFHGTRVAVTACLIVSGLGIYAATGWVGGFVVAIASGVVFVDATQRTVRRAWGDIRILHFVDAAVIGIAMIVSGLPDMIAIAPYAYLLVGAMLLLPPRSAMWLAASVGGWTAAIVVAGDSMGSASLPVSVVWSATAISLTVYLGSVLYLASVAAAAMRERLELDESLRTSRARLAAIVDGSPMVLFALDGDGVVTFAEGHGLSDLGAVAGEHVGVPLTSVVPDAVELHESVEEVVRTGEAVSRVIAAGDARFQVRLTPEFESSGEVSAIIAVATDETERVLSEEVLLRKIEMEQLISRLSTHLIGLPPEEVDDGAALALQEAAQFIGADRAFVSLAETPDRLVVSHHYAADGVEPLAEEHHTATAEQLPWLWDRLTAGRIVTVPHAGAVPPEAWQLNELWQESNISSISFVPIFLFRRFAGVAGIDSHRDDAFTPDDLVLLRFTAEMLVAMLHRKRAHEQLADLVRSKDQFIASVSHELRTPLTAVVGLAHELRDRPEDFEDGERNEFHRLLAEQAGEVSDIVEDLLVVARADIGEVSINGASVRLRPEVDSVLRGLGESDRVVTIDPDTPIEVWADRTRLRQVLRNLVSNALRYGGDRLEVRLIDLGHHAAIEVADNGGGLTARQAEELFEPYRHTAQVEGRPPSIGLGLTVGRKLAELMGGDLRFVPEDGWTVFRLELPVVKPADLDGFSPESVTQTIGASAATAELETVVEQEPATDAGARPA